MSDIWREKGEREGLLAQCSHAAPTPVGRSNPPTFHICDTVSFSPGGGGDPESIYECVQVVLRPYVAVAISGVA